MSSQDVAITSERPLLDKPKRSPVQGKLRQALDAMVWEGMNYDEAARTFNYHVRSMRRALARREVIAYLNSERQVLRASVSPKNIHRLVAIRDAADNMPAVNAIKLLEELGDDHSQRQSGASASPGVTIRVVTVVQSAPAGTYPSDMSRPDVKQINGLADLPSNAASAADLAPQPRPSDATPAVPESAPRPTGGQK